MKRNTNSSGGEEISKKGGGGQKSLPSMAGGVYPSLFCPALVQLCKQTWWRIQQMICGIGKQGSLSLCFEEDER